MNLQYLNFLKLITKDEISLLKEINRSVNVDKNNRYKFLLIPQFDKRLFAPFIDSLKEDRLYTVFPIISINALINEPHLALSETILITKYSNWEVLYNYINDKFLISQNQFTINENYFYLILKYKEVSLNFNDINKFILL
jgi:hypothetical protein